jgi:hypothetical protein
MALQARIEPASKPEVRLERLTHPGMSPGRDPLTGLARQFHCPAVWGLLAGFGFAYLMLFIPPFTPIFLGGGDQSCFLLDGMRIGGGQTIYRDFFELLLPGAPILYAGLIELFGVRAWIPNAALLLTATGMAWLSIVIAKRIVSGAAIIMPGLLFLGVSLYACRDATHHWYSSLLAVAAAAVLIDRNDGARMAAAGLLLGLATCFSQNAGFAAIVGLGVFIAWDKGWNGHNGRGLARSEAAFLFPAAVVIAICAAWCGLTAGWRKFFFCTIVFPLKYWPRGSENQFSAAMHTVAEAASQMLVRPRPTLLLVLFMTALIPAIYFVAWWVCWRKPAMFSRSRKRALVLVAAVGLSLFASVANSPNLLRLAAVSLPAFLTLAALTDGFGLLKGGAYAAAWILIIALVAGAAVRTQASPRQYVNTFSGTIAVVSPDRSAEFYRWLEANTRPGQYVLDTTWPDIYFSHGLKNPIKLPFLTACGYTPREQARELTADLSRHDVPLILWGSDTDPSADCEPGDDSLEELRHFVRSHYHPVKAFELGTVSVTAWRKTKM